MPAPSRLPPLSFDFLSPELGKVFRGLVEAASGIRLHEGKTVHVAAAVRERMEALGLVDPGEYLDRVSRGAGAAEETRRLLCRVVVGETSFFRTPEVYRAVRMHLFPRLLTSGTEHPLRIWSAGCATGEEAWSLAVAAAEAAGGLTDAFRILATDLSPEFLARAREGVYSRAAIAPLPPELAGAYFRPLPGDRVEVREELRRMVTFEELNLLDAPPPPQAPFSAVFCRNVMIYFGPEMTRRVVDMFHDALVPGGVLVLGHSETLWGISERFRVEEWKGAFYFRRGGGGPPEGKERRRSAAARPGRGAHRERGAHPAEGGGAESPPPERRRADAVPTAEESALSRAREAETLLGKGRLAEAAASAREAVSLAPAVPEGWLVLSLLARAEGKAGEGLRAAERALAAEPRFVSALLEAADALERLGRRQEAGSRWEEAVALLGGRAVLPRLPSTERLSAAMLRDYAVARATARPAAFPRRAGTKADNL
jgi:chemotaxis protein methyltransferase CheR